MPHSHSDMFICISQWNLRYYHLWYLKSTGIEYLSLSISYIIFSFQHFLLLISIKQVLFISHIFIFSFLLLVTFIAPLFSAISSINRINIFIIHSFFMLFDHMWIDFLNPHQRSMDEPSLNWCLSFFAYLYGSSSWLSLAVKNRIVMGMLIISFLEIWWMLDIKNLLEKEDSLLSKNKRHRSMSIYLIFSRMLCYGCIREPCNVQFRHNVRMVSFLLTHCQHLLYQAYLSLSQCRNRLILFCCLCLTIYFLVWDLDGQYYTSYAKLTLLLLYAIYNIYKSSLE